MFGCHGGRTGLRSRGGQWASDPVSYADPVQAAAFVNYVVRYFAEDDEQMLLCGTDIWGQTIAIGLSTGRVSNCGR